MRGDDVEGMFESLNDNDHNETPYTVSMRGKGGGGGRKGPELWLLPSQAQIERYMLLSLEKNQPCSHSRSTPQPQIHCDR